MVVRADGTLAPREDPAPAPQLRPKPRSPTRDRSAAACGAAERRRDRGAVTMIRPTSESPPRTEPLPAFQSPAPKRRLR